MVNNHWKNHMKNEKLAKPRFSKEYMPEDEDQRSDQLTNKLEKWKTFADRNLEAEKDWKFLKERNGNPNELAKEMLEVDNEVRKYLKRISEQYRIPKVILRSMISGVFTAFGATIIFAIVIFFMTTIYSSVKELPIIGHFIQDLHIDVFMPNGVANNGATGANEANPQ